MKNKICLILLVSMALFLGSCGQEPATLKVGDPAPDFSALDRQGKIWTLSDLKGQVVFINFWATWCAPCLQELPSMQRLYATLGQDGFKMLAILNNDKPNMADFVTQKKKITIPVLDDSSNVIGAKYYLTGLPETFIVDKKGIIRQKIIGGTQWDTPRQIKMMQAYINE